MFERGLRKAVSGVFLPLVLFFSFDVQGGVDISNRYRSPRNPERKVRQSTELIVLHTTEAPARSSLNKVSDRGECHFCVTEEGQIYRIVDRDREAFHAGRSMWNGKEDVDKFSVGIECVGYHNKAMPRIQLYAIRDLVKELKSMYRIPDERVVCHSHVAYGAPNKWQRFRHRGRKRCGMLFAMPSVRRILELRRRPAFDPDTRARRLTIGDDYLNSVLFGSIDTMIASYGVTRPSPARPAGRPPAQPATGKTSAPARPVKPAPAVVRTPAPKAEQEPPPPQPASKEAVRSGVPRSVAQLKVAGYVELGSVTKENSAMRIAGAKWNAADTFYVIRGKVTPGTEMDDAHIEKGMSIWRKK